MLRHNDGAPLKHHDAEMVQNANATKSKCRDAKTSKVQNVEMA